MDEGFQLIFRVNRFNFNGHQVELINGAKDN
jgi:hypothetical protein